MCYRYYEWLSFNDYVIHKEIDDKRDTDINLSKFGYLFVIVLSPVIIIITNTFR